MPKLTITLLSLFVAVITSPSIEAQRLARPAPPDQPARPAHTHTVPVTLAARLAADAGTRRETIAALIAEGNAGAEKASSLLTSSDPGVRCAAILVIASVRAVSKTPAIVRLLTTDTAEPVRIQAAEALGALGSPGSVPALIRIAESDPSSDVRVRAITALGRIDSPSVNAPIRRFLAHGSDLEFQVAAVAAGRRRLLDVEPDLLAICKGSDRSDRVRSAAVTALALMGSSNALGMITQLMRDSSPIVRFNAIGAIDEIQDKTSAADVTRILNDAGEAKFVRIRAASALARMGTKESLKALRTMSESHDEFMAMHAIVALSQADAVQAGALAAALHTRAQDAFVISVTERIVRGQALPWGQR